ncbi:hypothetical protein ACFFLM_14170 [Deinococcus oregonensis]|uniref:DUF4900 domain-containing protein n=1 Tax=Deinococcus oregonensis TaxID=1805970 RepID=A0ABV6B2M7_9DEIO
MHPPASPLSRSQGYVLVTALMAMILLTFMVTIYMITSLNSPRTVRSQADSLGGFLAAEGGLSMRAALIRDKFVGFERPTGTACPPSAVSGGGGDFACVPYTFSERTVRTGVRETTTTPDGDSGTVAEGERYAGLSYQQYSYRVTSEARQGDVRQATVQMEFQSRLVPLFQFAAFYNQDLEINPGPNMTLNGRVHTNGNLYLSPGDRLNISGQVSAQNSIFRNRKDSGACSGTVQFRSGAALGCGVGQLSAAQLALYGGNVNSNQPKLDVPAMGSLDPDPLGGAGNELWTKADLRFVAVASSGCIGGYCLQVQDSRGVIDAVATSALNTNPTCLGAVLVTSTLYDAREGKTMTLMDVNQQRLMDCIQLTPSGTFKDSALQPVRMDNTTQGGLVFHFSFFPPANNLGLRVQNAAALGTTLGVQPVGLTIATPQPIYVRGNYNVTNKVPASLLGDAINVLSGDWLDSDKTASTSDVNGILLKAAPTTINAAFLSGIVPTSGSNYSGGLENYPRFHENWTNVPFTYSGSFVSLGVSRYGTGRWVGGGNRYEAPLRDWSFDETFKNASKLPPLSPRFVYLRQLFFAREF